MGYYNPKSSRFKLNNKLTIVVLGRSGSGKGTQAKFIVRRLKKYGVKHIVTGDVLRAFSKKKGLVSSRTGRVIREGRLIPSWLISYLWSKELVEKGGVGRHLVFDGAPRKIVEAMLLDEAMEWLGRPLPVCVLIEVGEAEVTRRLMLRGRHDDTAAVIRNRLAYYPAYVLPVLRYYKKHGRLISVKGHGSVAEVRLRVDSGLKKRFGSRWTH